MDHDDFVAGDKKKSKDIHQKKDKTLESEKKKREKDSSDEDYVPTKEEKRSAKQKGRGRGRSKRDPPSSPAPQLQTRQTIPKKDDAASADKNTDNDNKENQNKENESVNVVGPSIQSSDSLSNQLQDNHPTSNKKKAVKRKLTDFMPHPEGDTVSNVEKEKKQEEEEEEGPPLKKRKKVAPWTDCEHSKFTQALELFGRDWKQISTFMGTRDEASIRSHAQVHFIKLLKKGEALPSKVLESGNGYTLSGNKLNKHSSIVKRMFGKLENVPMIDGVISDEEGAAKMRRQATKNDEDIDKKKEAAVEDGKEKEQTTTDATAAAKKKTHKKRRPKCDDSSDVTTDDDGQVFVSKIGSEPLVLRRSTRERKCTRWVPHLDDNEFCLRSDIELYAPYQMNPSKKERTQPFQVLKSISIDTTVLKKIIIEYCPNALIVAELHAHLCQENEIVGLLAGSVTQTKVCVDGVESYQHTCRVVRCYPLLEEQHAAREVNADPCDQIKITQEIVDNGLQVVGWYHSHPTFQNYPSNRDLDQHMSVKVTHRRDSHSIANKHHSQANDTFTPQPYIGLIIGSWSSATSSAEYRWFDVLKDDDGSFLPVQFNTPSPAPLSSLTSNSWLFQQIRALVERYSNEGYDEVRTNLASPWVPNSSGEPITNDIKNGSQECTSISREEKILQSLTSNIVADTSEKQMFVGEIMQLFRQMQPIWWKP
ncbi:hypothetical protein RFI_21857 [Reticulomyxa filosa]|uniref:Myb-like, SWIRM and MPN domain-containing protein 1 n=1 Tax=Reticulomyxa filosa TaxID=46433 RepID=X6MPZ9_RETFI|nr:hypothetical protein RFI_21857 [Reticulomyxa filosa]|eukprot:ETO15507.1 hypothetical protein RFI_21857 [Reticulomyxa filosa]